ncbi:MAG: hypothetical protein M1833_004306 [Piccolia ochrophora]|nr:MAG: hypothetical protein M1833_004306 [Piccolia ochrophora]
MAHVTMARLYGPSRPTMEPLNLQRIAHVTIIVKNKTAEVQSFQIFNAMPKYSQNVGEAWINVWGKSPGVGAGNGTTDFDITEEYFAVCGMSTASLQPGLVVSTSDYRTVELGTDSKEGTLVTAKIDKDGLVFDPKTGTLEKDGSFGIKNESWNRTKYLTAFCGLGMRSPRPEQQDVLPVAVFTAIPSQLYQITPHRTYYISTGAYAPGTIIDVTQLGEIAKLDFTGKKEDMAIVTLKDDYSYDVKYDYGT